MQITLAPRRLRATALVLAAALVVGACSSSGGSTPTASNGKDSPLGTAAKATAKVGGTVKGVITLAGGHTSFSGAWKGTLADGLGAATGRLPGKPSSTLDARWLKGQYYLRRTAKSADYGTSPLGQLAVVHPGTSLWAAGPASNLTARVMAPFSPPDLLSALAFGGKQTVGDGPTIDGTATRRVVVTGHVGLLFDWVGSKRAVVLLDQQDRMRRATVQYGSQSVQVEVAYSSATPKVSPPPASELATTAPPPPEPIGPFRTVRTGNDLGVAWTVQQAPGRDGGVCWRWSSTPALSVVQPNYDTDTRCFPPVAADADVTDQIQFVLWTDGNKAGQAAVVAAVPPGLTQATLGFVGGRTAPATITDGLLTWVGTSDQPLGYVGFQDGTTPVNCGIAVVSSPGDLTNDQLVGPNPFGAAWLCQT